MTKTFSKQKSIFISVLLFAVSILFCFIPVSADQVSTETSSITKGTTTVEFTNVYSACDIVIKKVVSGTENTDNFEFTVNISGLTAGMTITTSEGKMIADDDGNISETIAIAAGESVTIYGIPDGATYSVTEAASGYLASYEITNSASTGTIANGSAAASSTGQALSTETETADTGEEITITFTNTYPDALSLPSTGGVGRAIVMAVAGAVLIAGFRILTQKEKKPL